MTLVDIKQAIDTLSANELEQIRQYVIQKQGNQSSEKVGIIGDMHGDYDSFIKALDIFDIQGVNQILCAGDIVDRGSDADKIIKVIQERDILSIAGNHDRTVVANQDRWRQHKNPQRMRELGRIVSDKTITFLENLPDTLSTHIAEKNILVAHGTPWSDVLGAFPDSRHSTFERIYNEFADSYDVIILGHTHCPMHAKIDNLHILNAGSIYSITARDSHTFGILSLPDCHFTVYDIPTGNPIDLEIKPLLNFKT